MHARPTRLDADRNDGQHHTSMLKKRLSCVAVVREKQAATQWHMAIWRAQWAQWEAIFQRTDRNTVFQAIRFRSKQNAAEPIPNLQGRTMFQGKWDILQDFCFPAKVAIPPDQFESCSQNHHSLGNPKCHLHKQASISTRTSRGLACNYRPLDEDTQDHPDQPLQQPTPTHSLPASMAIGEVCHHHKTRKDKPLNTQEPLIYLSPVVLMQDRRENPNTKSWRARKAHMGHLAGPPRIQSGTISH